MTGRGKFVAIVAGIMILVMPAAAMPLHCVLMAPTGNNADHCHMAGMSSPAGQSVKGSPTDHSCCQGAAAKTESIALPRASSQGEIAVPPTALAHLFSVSATLTVRESFDPRGQLPGGPHLAVLCTFLI